MSELAEGPARPELTEIHRTKPASVFELAGGEAFFDELVHRFYARIATDPLLRDMYPDDLGPPERRLAMFLSQYWGGPPRYRETRGQPKLRLRHVPFAIGQAERDRWFELMAASLEEMDAAPEVHEAIHSYLDKAATFLMNR